MEAKKLLQFYLLLEFTGACERTWTVVDGVSAANVMDRVEQETMNTDLIRRVSTATLIPATVRHDLNVARLRDEREKAREHKEAADGEERDRAEYARLYAKFLGANPNDTNR